MTRAGLMERVRSWFGTKPETGQPGVGFSSGRWSLGPPPEQAVLALASAAAASEATAVAEPPARRGPVPRFPPTPKPPVPAKRGTPSATPLMPAPCRPQVAPLDPEWVQALEALPARIAESVAENAGPVPALDQLGSELEGHRETSRSILDAVRQLPELTEDQAKLARETNRILEKQCRLAEGILDGITSLRASVRTVEESSQRHVTALGQLEESHRRVLWQYQSMLLKAHRRLGRIAVLAMVVAAVALAGVGYVLYLTLPG